MSYKHLIIWTLLHYVFCQEPPLVSTTQGLVRGLRADDGDYYMYLGVPYGIVDQSNPFGASSPHPQFEGIFNATDDSAHCPQRDNLNGSLVGTLDCLHLSVFVPTTAGSTNLLPVLVWIFGGKFEFGSYGRYLYGPKYLVRHDIIVVSVNYRLGPFGFMCTDHPTVPGNQGLKDQLMAIKWMKANIENFGGDSSKITLDGNSAGSMSVDLQIIRNTDKLFNQAILQSGSSLSPSLTAPLRNAPLLLSEHLGFQADDILSAIKYLSNIEPLRIIEASKQLGLTYKPCIERYFYGVESFLNEDWVKKDLIPAAKDMNIMMGFDADEALGRLLYLGYNIATVVNDSLSWTFDIEHEKFTGLSDVNHFFFGDEELDDKMFESAIKLVSDLRCIHPMTRAVERFLKSDARKVYLYMFSYDGGRNFLKRLLNITRKGVTHADELGYLFDVSFMDEPNAEDHLIVDRMTTMWANFVKYGDPTPQSTALLPVEWKAVTAASPRRYIDITTDMRAGTRPFHKRMAFWDLFLKRNGHLQVFSLNAEADRDKMDSVFHYTIRFVLMQLANVSPITFLEIVIVFLHLANTRFIY